MRPKITGVRSALPSGVLVGLEPRSTEISTGVNGSAHNQPRDPSARIIVPVVWFVIGPSELDRFAVDRGFT